MNISKIGRHGEIAIPPARSVTTDRLAFIHRDNEVVLQPLKTTLSDFRGSVPVSEPQDFDVSTPGLGP